MTAKRRLLAQRRRVVGYTQEQLAAVLEVERSTVVRWEAGETTPQPWCRPKLAEALAVSLDELNELLAEGQTIEDGTRSSESRVNGKLSDLDAGAGGLVSLSTIRCSSRHGATEVPSMRSSC